MQRIKVTLLSSDGRVSAFVVVVQPGNYVPMIGNQSNDPEGTIFGMVVKLELVMDVPNSQTLGFTA